VTEAVRMTGLNVLLDSAALAGATPLEVRPTVPLSEPAPTLTVEIDGGEFIRYTIDPLAKNPDLTGQFLQLSVRVLPNLALMMDAIITKTDDPPPEVTDPDCEAIRFQPLFLPQAATSNDIFRGKGLFERGLHFAGCITPGTVRCCCVCDECRQSFSLLHFHAGMGQSQYFYSGDSRETLVVSLYEYPDFPGQLADSIDLEALAAAEGKLPRPSRAAGEFRYYNPFRCPHCQAPYVDFEKFPEIRPGEYYGNTLINEQPRHI